MNEYDFTLKFNLKDSQANPDDFIEQLYEGGCDDALIGVGNTGYVALNFIREASSAYQAISSAINNVKRVVPAATLIEAAADKLLLFSPFNIKNSFAHSIHDYFEKKS
jgi:hypothetical protein